MNLHNYLTNGKNFYILICMKKLIIYIICLLLLIVFCGKDSSSSNDKKEEDKAELRVHVNENGEPAPGIIVDVEVLIRILVQWEEDGWVHREWQSGTHEETKMTGSDGMARFLFVDMTLADEEVVKVQKIILKKSNVELLVDSTVYDIPKGGLKNLEYNIGQ